MEKRLDGDVIRLILNEDLTANNVSRFNERLDELVPTTTSFQTLVLDLSGTQNIDSVGVTFVIGVFKRMKSEQKIFKVSGATDDVQSLFRLMKLDQFFEMES